MCVRCTSGQPRNPFAESGRGVSVTAVIIAFDEYQIDDDASRIDRDAAWAFLSTEAYWNADRVRAEFDTQVAVAWRVVGAYESRTGRMVGFARAISDGCRFAYLADVFVLPEARGRGLGVAVVTAMIDGGPGAAFRWSLHTADAHGLYERLGFSKPDHMYLERPRGYGVDGAANAH